MEKLSGSVFESLELPSDAQVDFVDNTLIIKKLNWGYDHFLAFQTQAQKIIQSNRGYKIYIFCNHPHCFTLGRGNERGDKNLVAFNQNLVRNLKFEVHNIHRGGGITFHYPGQWIFYPIVSINANYTLEDHMCWLLKSVQMTLKNSFNVDKAMTAKKLMGVWVDRKKIASIGVGLNRFVSEHGIALNLVYDKEMFDEIFKINPCGMNSEIYTALSEIKDIDNSLIWESFHGAYLENIKM